MRPHRETPRGVVLGERLGVRIQGYLAHNKTPSQDPTVGTRLGPYGGPRGWAFSCVRGTPVAHAGSTAAMGRAQKWRMQNRGVVVTDADSYLRLMDSCITDL